MAEYKIGDFIVHEKSGVCQITDVRIMEMQGPGSEREYYCMTPWKQRNSQVYVPVESKGRLREIVSREEAERFMEHIAELEVIDNPNERIRVEQCKQMAATSDLSQIGAVIKTLYLKKKERQARGKRMMTQDERILNIAERKLFDELGFALEISCDEVMDRFCENLSETR